MLDQAGRNVPEATFLQRDIVYAVATEDRFDGVVAFFSLLMLPRQRIVEVIKDLHEVITSGGWLAIGMVEADFDDVPVPFLGAPVRVSSWPRDQLKQLVTDAGFSIEMEDVRSYAPPTPEAPPETQLFLLARTRLNPAQTAGKLHFPVTRVGCNLPALSTALSPLGGG
jgi:hypothetical protein